MNSPAPPRWAARLAWGLALLCLVLVGALIAIASFNHLSLWLFVSEQSTTVVIAVAFPFTGALIASRHPRNSVGWLMIGAALFDILSTESHEYAVHALRIEPGSWPGGAFASWISAWSWVPLVAMGTLLVMLLPNGRPASKRWRWLIYVTVADTTLLTIGFMAMWRYRGVRLLDQIETLPGLPIVTKVAVAAGFLLVPITLAGIASSRSSTFRLRQTTTGGCWL